VVGNIYLGVQTYSSTDSPASARVIGVSDMRLSFDDMLISVRPSKEEKEKRAAEKRLQSEKANQDGPEATTVEIKVVGDAA
jgi:hypothetical protein